MPVDGWSSDRPPARGIVCRDGCPPLPGYPVRPTRVDESTYSPGLPAQAPSDEHRRPPFEFFALQHRVENTKKGCGIGAAAGRPLPAHGVVRQVGIHQCIPEPACSLLPGYPQVFRQQRRNDHADPVMHVPRRPQFAYAGIHDRNTGLAFLPARQ